jgi:hypothetical protein
MALDAAQDAWWSVIHRVTEISPIAGQAIRLGRPEPALARA